MRIEAADRGGRALDLGLADLGRAVDHLALQVRQRDRVVVDDAERADTGRGQIEQRRRAQPAGADHQHARALERGLSGPADLAQHDVAGIAFKLLGTEHAVRSWRQWCGHHSRKCEGFAMSGRPSEPDFRGVEPDAHWRKSSASG